MKLLVGGLCALAIAASVPHQPVVAASSCEGLSSLVPDVTITLARTVAPGSFTPPGESAGASDSGPFRTLPTFCRVAATLTPSADSDIRIEVWMPVANWNGKLQAVGNGAFGGSIAFPALAGAVENRYAAASTNTGHDGNTGSFGLGHPEKVVDFGWRAVHEMTVASKRIIAAFYGTGPRLSYWNGCSAGGRQGLKAAQRFPADFDGIVAGAPGLDWTGRAAQAVRLAQMFQQDEAARIAPEQAQLLHGAVVTACDALDGVRDGVLEDPRRCTFDPGVLQCSGDSDASCLTAAQVRGARSLYSSLTSQTSKREAPGLMRGSELGWTPLGWTASARATGLDQFRFLVFKDPTWTVDRFVPAFDLDRADESDQETINAMDPNLKPFMDRGGRLIQYHGWSDPQISPGSSVKYYERVLAASSLRRVSDSYRLFMVPGMGHCRGGEGPSHFDAMAALERWVEQRVPPDRILASRPTSRGVDRTRPLCPHPQVAVYSGSGSSDEAGNFACRLP
jgi:feruloyl esterase